MNKDELEKIITDVVELFVFPDGCLDLGRDEQSAFIGTLADEIMDQLIRLAEVQNVRNYRINYYSS